MGLPVVTIVGHKWHPWPNVPVFGEMVSISYEPMWVSMLPDGPGSVEERGDESTEFQLDGVWYHAEPFSFDRAPITDRRELDGLLRLLAVARRSPIVIVDEDGNATVGSPLTQRGKAKFRASTNMD